MSYGVAAIPEICEVKLAPSVLAALGVMLALVLVDTCARRDERHKAEARQRDTRDDSTISRLVYEAAVTGSRFQRERDSTSREIRRLQQRIAGLGPAPEARPDADVSGEQAAGYGAVPLLLRDSLIASLLSGRQQDSLQLLFWRAQVAQRDSLIPALQRARDAWRARSGRRWFCVAGAGATMSLGGRGAVGPSVVCGYRL